MLVNHKDSCGLMVGANANEIRPLRGRERWRWISVRAFLASLVIPGLRDSTLSGRSAMGNRRPGMWTHGPCVHRAWWMIVQVMQWK